MRRLPNRGDIVQMATPDFTGYVRVLEIYTNGNFASEIGVMDLKGRCYVVSKEVLHPHNLNDQGLLQLVETFNQHHES